MDNEQTKLFLLMYAVTQNMVIYLNLFVFEDVCHR